MPTRQKANQTQLYLCPLHTCNHTLTTAGSEQQQHIHMVTCMYWRSCNQVTQNLVSGEQHIIVKYQFELFNFVGELDLQEP